MSVPRRRGLLVDDPARAAGDDRSPAAADRRRLRGRGSTSRHPDRGDPGEPGSAAQALRRVGARRAGGLDPGARRPAAGHRPAGRRRLRARRRRAPLARRRTRRRGDHPGTRRRRAGPGGVAGARADREHRPRGPQPDRAGQDVLRPARRPADDQRRPRKADRAQPGRHREHRCGCSTCPTRSSR